METQSPKDTCKNDSNIYLKIFIARLTLITSSKHYDSLVLDHDLLQSKSLLRVSKYQIALA